MNDSHVKIFDTTLRDGEQAPGCSMTIREKLRVASALAELNVDVIEAGFPAASPGDFDAVKEIAERNLGPIICGLARCNPEDIEKVHKAVKGADQHRIHVFVATSAIHREHKLKMAKEEIIKSAVGDDIPLFSYVIYPAVDRVWELTPLRKMAVGMFPERYNGP